MQHLQPNTTLQGGKYRIDRVLGLGGFGITYLAEQVFLQRKVAIKEFFMQEYCDRSNIMVVTNTPAAHDIVERFKKKFVSEASTIAKFHHPNIIDIYDVFFENDTAYYVMEYIEGKSLEEVVKQQGPLSEETAIGYIRQVGAALECMHNQKINHLDVKPNNIMLRSNNKDVVLIDFGISKQYDEEGKELTTTLVGISEGYAPLEQYQKGALKDFCPQTDIYALGATLYKFVVGETPPTVFDIINNGIDLPKNVASYIKNAVISSMKVRKEERINSISSFMKVLIISNNSDSIILGNAYNETTLSLSVGHNHIEAMASHLFQYDYGGHFSDGLAAVIKDGKYGYINKDGMEVIPCIYDLTYGFYDGLAMVKKDNQFGWIDKKGNTVIPIVYDFEYGFREGLAFVKKDNKIGCIDVSGNLITPFLYDEVFNGFNCGLASLGKNGKHGYLDKNGNVVIPFIYDYATEFYDGFAIVKKGDKYGCIDKRGNEVIPMGKYDCISGKDFSLGNEGLTAVMRNGKWGWFNIKGKEIIPCIYDRVCRFSEGLAAVWKCNWAYIDNLGNLMTKYKYLDAEVFYNGYAVVQNQNRNFGVIDKNFKEIIPYIYQEIFQFKSFKGFSVKINDKWGFLDENLKTIHPCVYDDRIWFDEGLAFVRKNGVLGCLDIEGRSTFDYM